MPPVLAAVTLAYNINLFGSITHYASGQAAVYYGSGFMNLKEVRSLTLTTSCPPPSSPNDARPPPNPNDARI